jgi:excisionase family DNA binding protein
MQANTEYLTTEELAARWKCSTWSLSQWAKAGRIRGAAKMGNAWRFPATAELVNAQTESELTNSSVRSAGTVWRRGERKR